MLIKYIRVNHYFPHVCNSKSNYKMSADHAFKIHMRSFMVKIIQIV